MEEPRIHTVSEVRLYFRSILLPRCLLQGEMILGNSAFFFTILFTDW